MAAEFQIATDTGKTLYVIATSGGQYLDAGVPALEDYDAPSWDDYDIPMTEDGASGFYQANMPAGAPAGAYTFAVYEQAGGSPATTDEPALATGWLYWDGAAEVASGDYPTAAEINAEVDQALADIHLDHLLAVAESDTAVDDSVIAKLAASDGDWSGFSETSDSLEAIRDLLRSPGVVTMGPGLAQGTLKITYGDAYYAADGNSLTFSFTEAYGRDFDGKDATLAGKNNEGDTFSWSATITQADTTVTVTVEDLAEADTQLDPDADWRWQLAVDMGSSREITPAKGRMVVEEDLA